MPLTIGITLGDVTGVGPEVTLKALAAELAADDTRYVVVGSARHVRAWAERIAWVTPFRPLSEAGPSDRLILLETDHPPLPDDLAPGAAPAAEAALAWLTETARLCLRQQLDGMVTAPLSKEAILRTGRKFTGQTEYLTELAGNPETAMMLLGPDPRNRWLRVALVTTHLPLAQVPHAITPAALRTAVRLSAQACRDLGLPTARVAVCGLNPHAGEGGLLGDEEERIIRPTIRALQSEGFEVTGPVAGDTVFHAALEGGYDAVVAMYHDQGLAPLKLAAFDTGVNWTLGLPFIRTSPDHGTAYDIAGRGVANPSSMRAALQLARQLARSRIKPTHDA